jgi:hypothetical protein
MHYPDERKIGVILAIILITRIGLSELALHGTKKQGKFSAQSQDYQTTQIIRAINTRVYHMSYGKFSI